MSDYNLQQVNRLAKVAWKREKSIRLDSGQPYEQVLIAGIDFRAGFIVGFAVRDAESQRGIEAEDE